MKARLRRDEDYIKILMFGMAFAMSILFLTGYIKFPGLTSTDVHTDQNIITIASKYTLNNQQSGLTEYYFKDTAGLDHLVSQHAYETYNIGDMYDLNNSK